MKKYIFVYGTLKRKRGNHHVMGKSKFLYEFMTPAIYTLVTNGSYPIVKRGGNTAITGEVFEVTDPIVLNRIYMLEGYRGTQGDPHNWYDTDNLTLPDGNIAEIFVQNANAVPTWRVLEDGIF